MMAPARLNYCPRVTRSAFPCIATCRGGGHVRAAAPRIRLKRLLCPDVMASCCHGALLQHCLLRVPFRRLALAHVKTVTLTFHPDRLAFLRADPRLGTVLCKLVISVPKNKD